MEIGYFHLGLIQIIKSGWFVSWNAIFSAQPYSNGKRLSLRRYRSIFRKFWTEPTLRLCRVRQWPTKLFSLPCAPRSSSYDCEASAARFVWFSFLKIYCLPKFFPPLGLFKIFRSALLTIALFTHSHILRFSVFKQRSHFNFAAARTGEFMGIGTNTRVFWSLRHIRISS